MNWTAKLLLSGTAAVGLLAGGLVIAEAEARSPDPNPHIGQRIQFDLSELELERSDPTVRRPPTNPGW
ncbi:MAG: hypothetical protein WBF53_00880, partial [Litorimonas sp.]